MQTKEGGNILIIVIGIILIFVLVGFFNSGQSFWSKFTFKQLLRLPCGLTLYDPKPASAKKAEFPMKVNGYINGCGWNADGLAAGTAQVFDGKGAPITAPETLVIPADSINAPQYFSAALPLIAAPHTDTGNLLITSTTGLLRAIPVRF